MEKHIFIHGSSSGQCSLTLSLQVSNLCEEIGKYYFEGRDNRLSMGLDDEAMFVELFRTSSGQIYCLYSFVVNSCFGPTPGFREGNYFALTLALKGNYCTKINGLYNLLSSAFQKIVIGNVLESSVNHDGKNYRYVYKVPQLGGVEDKIKAPLGKILDYFDSEYESSCKQLPSKVVFPLPWNGKPLSKKNGNKLEPLPWNGINYHPEECDSGEAISHLINDGRIVVYEKAERSSDRLQRLIDENREYAAQVKSLNQQIEEIRNQYVSRKSAANDKLLKDANLAKEKLEAEKKDLSERISCLEGFYDELGEKMEKYRTKTHKDIARINSKIIDEASHPHTWTRWIKYIFLVLILLTTTASMVLNVLFFRGMPQESNAAEKNNSRITTIDDKGKSGESGQTRSTMVTCSNTQKPVSMPSSGGYSSSNGSAGGRELHGILDMERDESVTVSTHDRPSTPNYGLKVTNESNVPIDDVYPGQRIRANVGKPMAGCDFHFHKCKKEGSDKNPIWVIVDSNATTSIIISYGPPDSQEKREKKVLNVIR